MGAEWRTSQAKKNNGEGAVSLSGLPNAERHFVPRRSDRPRKRKQLQRRASCSVNGTERLRHTNDTRMRLSTLKAVWTDGEEKARVSAGRRMHRPNEANAMSYLIKRLPCKRQDIFTFCSGLSHQNPKFGFNTVRLWQAWTQCFSRQALGQLWASSSLALKPTVWRRRKNNEITKGMSGIFSHGRSLE